MTKVQSCNEKSVLTNYEYIAMSTSTSDDFGNMKNLPRKLREANTMPAGMHQLMVRKSNMESVKRAQNMFEDYAKLIERPYDWAITPDPFSR